ncbi:MAG TPA: family 78 glycoside hydrolase catalytic domain [Candidatus Hydrogenedentes bacterium]|nr:family 78 glycoside hydrolase catalytic domain [Candidatus Hydrogenedentota bacterium]HOC67753.1 family 78 glycoside hydrolase catalytic domain [Candidatus Hydrogenedentota bacterium]
MHFIKIALLYSTALALLACVNSTAEETVIPRPRQLRCDGCENPLGVESKQPILSWTFDASRRRLFQSAYQVLVASTPGLLVPGRADAWDPGKIDGDGQRVLYEGHPPASVERFFWTVRIWDEEGHVSEWAAPASWTMGELNADSWDADWIAGALPKSILQNPKWIWVAGEDAFKAAMGAARFLKRVTVRSDASLVSASLYVAADNHCDLFINKKQCPRVSGWREPVMAAVMEHFRPGDNQLELRVVNDWEVPNPAGVLLQLDLHYDDGGKDTVVTDGSWCGERLKDGSETVSLPKVQELGPYDMDPWKTVSTIHQEIPLFRKEFAVANTSIRYALMNICGLGHCELFLNGQKVGDHVLDPGWTDYKDTCLYVPFDVTSMLHPGGNVFGVMLGNGLYNVVGGRYTKFTGSYGEPKMIAQLHIVYEDGTEQTVASDESWSTHKSPIAFSCAYGGEDYDARLELPGWCTPEFDASSWCSARITDGPGGVLRAQQAPPIKIMDTLEPVSIQRIAPGRYEADMGYNLSARPVLTVKGKAGAQVTMRVGERPGMPWEGHWYTYTLHGRGEETYRPFFTYFGFQYITVEGADIPDDTEDSRPVLINLASEFVTSDSPEVGSFSCANPLLNDIHAMITRSVRSNLQSVLTDCPHREKLGWLEVAHLMGPSILYHFDAQGLYRKICRDTTESQLENGLVPDIAPEYTRFQDGFFESPEWGSSAVQLPWLLYRWYGDTEILARQYDTMARYTRYLACTRNIQGLAKAGLGDWYDWTPEKGHTGYAQLTPGELTATAMLFDNARILAKVAAMTGQGDEAETFAALSRQVREDFMDAYYDGERKTVAKGSQSALAIALYFDLLPEKDRDQVLCNLVAALENDAYKPSTGEVCFRYMIMALARAGRSDIVYRIINRYDCPGYGWMLHEFGLQTLSERWDKPGSSLNHCMFGHAQEWFQAYLLGIRQPDEAVGFENVLIGPEPPEGLQEASGYFDSPRGRIAVDWKSETGAFSMNVSIPGNTNATILLPVPDTAVVTESNLPLESTPGIQVHARNEKVCPLTIGSGRYRFCATW